MTVEEFVAWLDERIAHCDKTEKESNHKCIANYWAGRGESYMQVKIEFKKILPQFVHKRRQTILRPPPDIDPA